MDSIDSFTRHCIRVSVAQICQVIGWTSIQSTPLEILTDLLQEYIMSLARMTNNYATHYGVNSPGVQHVGLSLKTIGVSFNELAEYVGEVEASPAVDVPCYPVPKENHLNLLKPGSREVVTRPVHIHEHLPPIHPNLQDEDVKEILPVEESANDTTIHVDSQKGVFKKPGDPDNLFRKQKMPVEEEVRALREITSVMMTTSGFLSPAREGKLPEARTPASSQGTMTTSITHSEKIEVLPHVVTTKDRKKKKLKEHKNKEIPMDQDNKTSRVIKVSKEVKPKIAKVSKPIDRSPSPNPKFTPFVSTSTNTSGSVPVKNSQRKSQSASPLLVQGGLLKPARSPISEKSPKIENHSDEIKLPSELDKQKLNIFKKISKVKDEVDIEFDVKEEEKWTGLDEVIDAVSRGTINIKDEIDSLGAVPSIKTEPDLHIDVVSTSHVKENFDDLATPINSGEVPRPPECKKRKKEKHKEKSESRHSIQEQNAASNANGDVDHINVKPLISAIEEQVVKSNLPMPSNDLSIHSASSFPYYPFPSGVLTHPLIPQGPPVLGPYPHLSNPALEQQQALSRSSSSQLLLGTIPPPLMPPPVLPQTTVMSSTKKKEHKKTKKLKDKLKKKKGKKEKNRAKIKSEKKRLKLEKKEREKEKIKSKKGKKEKKKEKEMTEDKPETQNVPKITLKLSPVSTQDSATDACLRKIVIKPVVKKDDDKMDPWPATNVSGSVAPQTTKLHKSQKSFKNGQLSANCNIDEEPKIVPPSVAHSIHHGISNPLPASSRVQEVQSEYICPACNRPDDGSPMIACDSCDLWFHWICVGIQEQPPESDWYCRKCTAKMDGLTNEKRRKHKRKKTTS